MFEARPSVREPVADGLVLRAVESGGDVERLADFNGRIHGGDVAVLTGRLLRDHPHTRARHWLLVEEPSSGRIVSSLCLIPWLMRFDGVELQAGEMGIVGTEPEYRRKGLIRALVSRFDRLLADEGFDLSHIQGIPYFYRQFGYRYAVRLIPDLRLALDAVPDGPLPPGWSVRRARTSDVQALTAAYARLTASAALAACRDEATWLYLLDDETAGEGETWCVERESDGVVGYFRTHRRGFGHGLIVSEASPLGAGGDAALLAELVRRARAADKPYVKLELDPACEIGGIARSLGAQAKRTYAWQIRFVELAALLRKLAPALERRLEASAFAGLTERLVLSLYGEAFALEWKRGRLAAVDRLQPVDSAPVQLPPETLVPLLLGHRSLSELADWHPDVRVEPRAAALLEALFPKLRSYLYTIY